MESPLKEACPCGPSDLDLKGGRKRRGRKRPAMPLQSSPLKKIPTSAASAPPVTVSPGQSTSEQPSGLSCTFCGVKFLEIGELQSHSCPCLKQKSFQCKTCGAEFSRFSMFRVHVYGVRGQVPPFNCQDCEASFSDACSLQRHRVASRHQKSNRLSYACKICEDRFGDVMQLKQHETTAHADVADDAPRTNIVPVALPPSRKRDKQCRFCNRRFSYASTLEEHEKRHAQ